LFKTRGTRPPTAPYSFTGLKEYAEKGLPLAWSTPARISGVINTGTAVDCGVLILTVLNGNLAQWVSNVKLLPGSAVPVLVKKPETEGAGRDQAPRLWVMRSSGPFECTEGDAS
jgi:hypothetical protein